MNFNPTMFTAFFGCHIKAGEANELVLAYQEVTEEKITIKSDVETFSSSVFNGL